TPAVVFLLPAVLIITIPLGVFFFVNWSFFTQAIVIEGDGVMAALRRSRAIVANQWWRTFGIGLAILLLAVLPSIVIGRVTAPFSAAWVAALGGAVAAALAAPFRGLAQTLLYADLRRRKGEKPFSEPSQEVT